MRNIAVRIDYEEIDIIITIIFMLVTPLVNGEAERALIISESDDSPPRIDGAFPVGE